MANTNSTQALQTAASNHTEYAPFSYSEIGDRLTNTEAERLLGEMLVWAGQFHHEEARSLQSALSDMNRLLTRVWTEIDESLARLSHAKRDPSHTDEHIQVAMEYLSRWQDRRGRVGNAVMGRA